MFYLFSLQKYASLVLNCNIGILFNEVLRKSISIIEDSSNSALQNDHQRRQTGVLTAVMTLEMTGLTVSVEEIISTSWAWLECSRFRNLERASARRS